jgi:hypothetical protein
MGFSSPRTISTRGTRLPATSTRAEVASRSCPPVCKVICRAGQAHPDKQHVLIGVLATSIQPRQHGDRDIGSRAPGAARLPPGEVIYVRLEHIQDPSPSRTGGHRPVGTKRPQFGRDLVGEFQFVFTTSSADVISSASAASSGYRRLQECTPPSCRLVDPGVRAVAVRARIDDQRQRPYRDGLLGRLRDREDTRGRMRADGCGPRRRRSRLARHQAHAPGKGDRHGGLSTGQALARGARRRCAGWPPGRRVRSAQLAAQHASISPSPAPYRWRSSLPSTGDAPIGPTRKVIRCRPGRPRQSRPSHPRRCRTAIRLAYSRRRT